LAAKTGAVAGNITPPTEERTDSMNIALEITGSNIAHTHFFRLIQLLAMIVHC